MDRFASRFWLGLVMVVAITNASNCGSHHTAAEQANLSGKITDESGSPIAGATLTPSSGATSITSDIQGAYKFDTTADMVGGILISADNHVSVSRSLPAGITTQDFVLKKVDLSTSISLPNGAAAAQNFSVSHGGGALALSLPPDALVTPDGKIATGQAQLSMTYWNPNEPMQSMPAELLAHSPFAEDEDSTNIGLRTFGMFDVGFEQNGVELQVAPNANLRVIHTLPDGMASSLANDQNAGANVFLWTLDQNTQAWRLSADSSFDLGSKTLSVALGHLSSYNFDDLHDINPPKSCTVDMILNNRNNCGKKDNAVSLGGCIQGTIKDKDGNPVAGNGTLWLFSQEGIYDVTVPTDSSGHFCYNAGLRVLARNPRGAPYLTTNTVPSHTSVFRQPDNSTDPDPIPSECKAMSQSSRIVGWNKYPTGGLAQWNSCGLVSDDFSGLQATHKPVFAPKETTVHLCAYCPGTGPSTCPTGGAVTHNCAVAGNNEPACGATLKLGDACTAETAKCCPNGTVCADGICTPSTDTSVSP